MGYNIQCWNFVNKYLQEFYGDDLSSIKMLELGNQHIKKSVQAVIKKKTVTAKKYFKSKGIGYTSVDFNGENGSIIHDLGDPIRNKEWIDSFDVVTNMGTSEHVSPIQSQYECFKNIHVCCKTGGIMLHSVPEFGSCKDHCPVYYTLDFFRNLAEKNSYRIIHLGKIIKNGNNLIHACFQKVADSSFLITKELFFSGIEFVKTQTNPQKTDRRPLVSVIIPLYNYKKYIADCINSVRRQNYTNVEIIVVDDCSTDGSADYVARTFANKGINLIRFKKNRGYSTAKNEGIIASNGLYLTILDADDMLTKKSLIWRVEAMLEEGTEFCHADAISVKNNITYKQCCKIKKPVILHYPTPYEIHAQTVLIKRDLYKKFGLYEEKLRSASDREMWWRFFGQSEKDLSFVSRSYVNKPVAFYRYHKKQMTRYRQANKKYNKKVHSLARSVYDLRKTNGINKDNTRIWED
jgi:hypothetical protein